MQCEIMFLAKLSNKTKNLNFLMFTTFEEGQLPPSIQMSLPSFFVIKYRVL